MNYEESIDYNKSLHQDDDAMDALVDDTDGKVR